MSGYARSSVSTIPDSGSIQATSAISIGETETIAQPKAGETWKILSIVVNNANIGIGNALLKLTDSDGVSCNLTDVIPCTPSADTLLNYTTNVGGDLFLDNKLYLQIDVTLASLSVKVSYVKVN